MKYMSALGCAVARINTTGIYDENLGKYRFSGSTKGVEDINCVYPAMVNGTKIGLTIAVEVKIGKDRLSSDQVARKEKLESVGAKYIVAKTFDEFKKDVDNILYEYKSAT